MPAKSITKNNDERYKGICTKIFRTKLSVKRGRNCCVEASFNDNPSKSLDFKVSIGEGKEQFPPELTSFVDGHLFGQRKLSSEKSSDRKVLVGTIASSIMHNIRTNHQVNCIKRKTRSSHNSRLL